MFTWSIFVATTILGATPPTADPESPPPRQQAAEDNLSVRELLIKFDKHHQQSTTGPSEKENLKLQMECMVKLMRIGPAAVPVLIECLKNEKAPPSTRALAAQALGFLADVRARPTLLQAIEDKDGLVRASALGALGRLGRLKATPKLLELAGKDPTRGVYVGTMFVLTRDDEPNPEPIRKALAEYDLARMDSAQVGKPAPDFTLTDASGKTWRLRDCRGKKTVVLIFLVGTN
jgi:HEAT repeat protein